MYCALGLNLFVCVIVYSNIKFKHEREQASWMSYFLFNRVLKQDTEALLYSYQLQYWYCFWFFFCWHSLNSADKLTLIRINKIAITKGICLRLLLATADIHVFSSRLTFTKLAPLTTIFFTFLLDLEQFQNFTRLFWQVEWNSCREIVLFSSK